MILEIKAKIEDKEFELKSLFGLEAFTSYAEFKGLTMDEVFAKFGNIGKGGGIEILSFVKELSYYAYINYCELFDIYERVTLKKYSVIFDHAGDLKDMIEKFSTVVMGTFPQVDETMEAKKKV